MQVPFTSPTSAALPQEELHSMTHTQLVQAANVLHAGWMAANKKISAAELQVQQIKTLSKQQTEELRSQLIEMSDNYRFVSGKYAEMKSRHHKYETEVIQLRRAFAQHRNCHSADDESATLEPPEVAVIKEQLLLATADVLRLERIVGMQISLNTEQLQAEVQILRNQRDDDRLRLQEAEVDMENLKHKLVNAQDELEQVAKSNKPDQKERDHKGLGSTMRSMAMSLRSQTSQHQQDSSSTVEGAEKSMSPRDPLEGLRDPSTQEVTCQTDSFLLHAIDLFESSNEKNKQLTAEVTSLKIRLAERDTNIAGLTERLQKLRMAYERKIVLLAELAGKTEQPHSPQRSRSGSEVSVPVEGRQYSRNTEQELRDRLARREIENDQLEKKLADATQKAINATRNMERLNQSVRTVEHENLKLVEQVRIVTNASPKKLGELLSATEELRTLREKLKNAEIEVRQVRALQEELQNTRKEAVTLSARVSKYQSELTITTSRNEMLTRHVRELREENASLSLRLEEVQNELTDLASADKEMREAGEKERLSCERRFLNMMVDRVDLYCTGLFDISSTSVFAKQNVLHLQWIALCTVLVRQAGAIGERVRQLGEEHKRTVEHLQIVQEETARSKFEQSALSSRRDRVSPFSEATVSHSASVQSVSNVPRLGMHVGEIFAKQGGEALALIVQSVDTDSAASTATILAGDVIQRIGGTHVTSLEAMERVIRSMLQKTRAIDIAVSRAGQEEDVVLLL